MSRPALLILFSIFVLSCSTKNDIRPSGAIAASGGPRELATVASADGSPILCGGASNTSSGLIYLHGMDSVDPSPQEMTNRQILQDVSNKLNIRLAIPRATSSCPNSSNQICWGWTFNNQERSNVLSKIGEAATGCNIDIKKSVIVGFSNGGYAVNALFEQCKLDSLKLSVSSGAAKYSGQLPQTTPSLSNCGSLALLVGTSDTFNFDSSHNLESQLRAKGANVSEVDFDGGHTLSKEALINTLAGILYPRVVADLQTYDKTVVKMKEELSSAPVDLSNKDWIKSKLENMYKIDQFMRSYGQIPFQHQYSSDEDHFYQSEYMERFQSVDLEDLTTLKQILTKSEWITVSQFGAKADDQAWIIVQHADQDPEFQKKILSILEKLYASGETKPDHYAYLFDRVAMSFVNPSKRTLQRFGTQGHCVGPGSWAPFPIEDPDHVDQRRASVGLGAIEDYKKMFKDICRKDDR